MLYLIKFILFLIITNNVYANENKTNQILFKINNKFFTNIDLEKRKEYVAIINNFNQSEISESENIEILEDYISSLIFYEYYIQNKLIYKNLNDEIDLINKISVSSGHLGIAGGQYLDLNYERKKVSKKKIVEMEIKKTGKLFSFCCVAPLIIKRKNKKDINKFEKIGADIGLLFQVADDLIDYKGSLFNAGKKTGKDKKKGKATLISLIGYKNTVKYGNNLILKINSKLKKYGSKSKNLSETLNYILNRNK